VYRAVVFEDTEKQFRLFMGRMIVGRDEISETPSVVKAGPLRLIEITGEAADLSTADGIAELISSWRTLVKAPALPFVLNTGINVRREWSLGVRSIPPSWHFELSYSDKEPMAANIPSGPFIDPVGGFFASDIGDAAAQWLDVPWFRQHTNPQKSVEVTLIDNRAYLSHLALEGTTLTVHVHRRTQTRLHCTVITRDYQNVRDHSSEVVTGDLVQVAIPIPAKSLEIFLTDDDGFCFDQHAEDERGLSSRRVLTPAARSPKIDTDLRVAVEGGENEHVEFKEWLPLERGNKKSAELLRTVCAFANSLGGDLFVGVSDSLEIVGCARELARALKLPLEECRVAYAQQVQRILAEGISPTVPADLSWLSHAGLDVLRISVPPTGAAHYLIENNDAYVRRGASSRKATLPEIDVLLARAKGKQPSSESGAGGRSWVAGP
jgi:hypothetical protein